MRVCLFAVLSDAHARFGRQYTERILVDGGAEAGYAHAAENSGISSNLTKVLPTRCLVTEHPGGLIGYQEDTAETAFRGKRHRNGKNAASFWIMRRRVS